MHLETLQTAFSNKTYAIWKQIHNFFLLLRSSILKLNYLYNFGSSITKIRPWSSPLKLLCNATGLTSFGFFKSKLCPISHNELIMDSFNRVNLYGMPRVIVSSFGFEIDTKETTVRLIQSTFYIIPIRCLERELWRFSHYHLFEKKFGSLKNP